MPEDINNIQSITGNNGEGSFRKVILSQQEEVSHGYKCGTASCENCPVTFEMKMGPDSKMGYRNVFSDLKIMTVILFFTFVIKEALTLLPI